MNMPNVIHPTTYRLGEIHLRIASYFPLTEPQARAIAMHSYRSRKWKKADAKKTHTILWTGDQSAAAMFG
ncbi:hypothetical protein [Comamonas brasiliensis]|uniref:hypothetical protein n=1 Tax=Comamonas brasiliensis TaxID=1812482 RepID=UPI001B8C159D|nr:hypothetical protein [Comamonas sp. PE63]